MEQNEEKAFVVNQILSVDNYQATKETSDLTHFCALLNGYFADLVKAGFIGLNTITLDMVKGVAVFNAEPIIKAVSELYGKEEGHIKYQGARRIIGKAKSLALDEIKQSVSKLEAEYTKQALKFYNPSRMGENWRVRYLTLQDGNVGFDKDAVLRDCTQSVNSEAQADLLNRADDLKRQIQDFNVLCEKHGGVGVGTLFDGMADKPIIGLNDRNELFFDANATSLMSF